MSRLPWRQIAPCLLTGLALMTGFASILVSVQSMYQESSALHILAARLIILAMILDGLDGFFARLLRGTTAFGAELDTFVDFSAFGIAPAVLLHAVAHDTGGLLSVYILPALIVLSGGVRLARFRVSDPQRGQGGYTGLPITVNAAWIAMAVFVVSASGEGGASLAYGLSGFLFAFSVMLLLVLQVSRVKYPKVVKHNGVFFGSIVLVQLVWQLDTRYGIPLAFTLIMAGLMFVLWPLRSHLASRYRGAV